MNEQPYPEIIARLEAEKEGNRELDDEIYTAIGGKDPPPAGALWRHTVYSLSAPHYTTSTDAAMMLLSASDYVELKRYSDGGGWYARVGKHSSSKPGSRRNQTPALAMCIACLRARSASLPATDASRQDTAAEDR